MIFSRPLARILARLRGHPDEANSPTRELIEPHVPNPVPADFMVVLRESIGLNISALSLEPVDQELQTALSLAADSASEDLAWYHFLADMHIRFVSYVDGVAHPISRDKFLAYELSVEDAIDVALHNIRRTFGEPTFRQWSQGVQIVQGESPDIDSSYLLDDEFWEDLDSQHPEGLVVAVPKRGGLLFATANDSQAVDLLTQNVTYLHSTSAEMRVSGALLNRKAGRWSLRQEAVDD